MHTQPTEKRSYCTRCRHELISPKDDWEELICSDCIAEEDFELDDVDVIPRETRSQELSSFGARWNRIGGPSQPCILTPGRHQIP